MEKCPLYVKSSEEQACGCDQNSYKNVSHAKNWVKELNCFGRKEDRGQSAGNLQQLSLHVYTETSLILSSVIIFF